MLTFAAVIIALREYLKWRRKKSLPPELSDQRVYADNMEGRYDYIKKSIEACWEEKVLNTYLGHIEAFQRDYHYNYNAKYYTRKLTEAYEQQKTNIYREQLRAEMILEEMKNN